MTSKNKITESKMDDDDAPPMLVAADGSDLADDANLNAEMEDVKVSKVPISIITGKRLATDVLLREWICRGDAWPW